MDNNKEYIDLSTLECEEKEGIDIYQVHGTLGLNHAKIVNIATMEKCTDILLNNFPFLKAKCSIVSHLLSKKELRQSLLPMLSIIIGNNETILGKITYNFRMYEENMDNFTSLKLLINDIDKEAHVKGEYTITFNDEKHQIILEHIDEYSNHENMLHQMLDHINYAYTHLFHN